MAEAPTGTTTPPTTGAPSGATAPASASGGEAAPAKITAKKHQYFCEFAAEKGFRNCEKWRAKNPDLAEKPTLDEGDEVIVPAKDEKETSDKDKAEVQSKRADFPPASVKFLTQTTPMGDRKQAGATRIGISNYITDKAGLNDHGHSKGFFEEFGADDEAGRNANADEVTTWNDPDHFRVEVHDVTAGKNDESEVHVELQVLQPLYKRETKAGKTTVARDEKGRPDPNAPKGFRLPGNPKRQAVVECKRVGDTNYYRSKYLRLVTEEGDHIEGQTLFVGDYYQDAKISDPPPTPTIPGHGPSVGAIVGGAAIGAVVAGGAAYAVTELIDNDLSGGEQAGIVAGAAVAGGVAGGLIGAAASSEDAQAVPGSAPKAATPMTPQEKEDTRRYGEILHQKVRARYTPAMCTQQICRAESLADVGELRHEMRLAVHILDNCCSYEDVRRVVYGQVRRVYAAAGLRPHLKAVYKKPTLENIILIGRESGTGLKTRGNTGSGSPPPQSKLTFEVESDTFTIKLNAGQTVTQVAGAVKSKLEGHRDGGKQVYWTRTVERPTQGALAAGEEGSRYVLVFKDKDMNTLAEVNDVDCDDADFSTGMPFLDSTDLGQVTHDGDDHEHVLIKACCHTDHFNGIIIKDFDNTGGSILFGIATWLFEKKMFPPAFIVHSPRVKESPNDKRYTFAHEMGHVLMNGGHFTKDDHKEQLMIKGAKATGNAYDMPGRRRIADKPMKVAYQPANADGTWPGAAPDWLVDLDGSTAALATVAERCHKFMTSVATAFGGETDPEPAAEW